MNPEWQVNENYTLLKKGDFQIVFFKLLRLRKILYSQIF